MILIHRGMVYSVLLLYWFLEYLQTAVGTVLDLYVESMWRWGWYDKWYDDMLNGSRRANRKRLALQNRYLMVKKRIETIDSLNARHVRSEQKHSVDQLSLSDVDMHEVLPNNESAMMIITYGLRESSIVQMQVFDIVRRWCPVFCNNKCDIRIVARAVRMKISIQVNYSTSNETYRWGLMNTKTGQILGKIKMQAGKNNKTTIHFDIDRMIPGKRYCFRFMQRLGFKGYVYIHMNNSITGRITFLKHFES